VSTSGDADLGVGPVLQATPFARSVVSVIEEENRHVLVRDEGAYLRVLVPRVCRLSRAGSRPPRASPSGSPATWRL
jgi:hypothetical protein